MRLLLTSEELASLIKKYEAYEIKELINFTVKPYVNKEMVIQRYEVTFSENSLIFAANFIFKAGIEHGKKGLL